MNLSKTYVKEKRKQKFQQKQQKEENKRKKLNTFWFTRRIGH